jgi:hypothetical protein
LFLKEACQYPEDSSTKINKFVVVIAMKHCSFQNSTVEDLNRDSSISLLAL